MSKRNKKNKKNNTTFHMKRLAVKHNNAKMQNKKKKKKTKKKQQKNAKQEDKSDLQGIDSLCRPRRFRPARERDCGSGPLSRPCQGLCCRLRPGADCDFS